MLAVPEKDALDRLRVELGALLVRDVDIGLATEGTDVRNRRLDAGVCLVRGDVTVECSSRRLRM